MAIIVTIAPQKQLLLGDIFRSPTKQNATFVIIMPTGLKITRTTICGQFMATCLLRSDTLSRIIGQPTIMSLLNSYMTKVHSKIPRRSVHNEVGLCKPLPGMMKVKDRAFHILSSTSVLVNFLWVSFHFDAYLKKIKATLEYPCCFLT